MYTKESIFTILHSKDLAAMLQSGSSGTFIEGKKWLAAAKLLKAARLAGEVVPVIFTPGEEIQELTHFAELKDLQISQDGSGKWSTLVSVTNLTKIGPPSPRKRQLVVCTTGEKLLANHIRPSVLVTTPNFLTGKTTVPTTLFTWGYYGWGNHTPQLVEAVDAVERSRGFAPPLFVDIRISRSVRAEGFKENAFGKLIGPDRYRWMKSLGNKYIQTRKGKKIQIAEPEAAEELLDLAIDLALRKQRLLFFCACQYPLFEGEITCHRTTVAELVLKAARRRGVEVEIVEWPGGEPAHKELNVTPQVFAAVRKGRMSVPLGDQPDLADLAGLPWCSTATLHSNGEKLHRLVGPAIAQTSGWTLPVLMCFLDPATELAEYEEKARILRKACGLNPAQA